MAEFFDMNGYGAFIWPCYLISALVLGSLALASIRRGRSLRQALDQLQADAPHRRDRV